MRARKQSVTTKVLDELDALRLEKSIAEQRMLEAQLALVRMQGTDYLRQLEEKQDVKGWDLNLNQRLWTKPPAPTSGAKP